MKESLVYGLFGGLIGSLYMGWIYSHLPKYQQAECQHTCCGGHLAVVDMQALISKKSQQLAKERVRERLTQNQESLAQESPTGELFRGEPSIGEAADRLKKGLKVFAARHNLILLTKGAIVQGDVPDKTDEILGLIEKGDF